MPSATAEAKSAAAASFPPATRAAPVKAARSARMVTSNVSIWPRVTVSSLARAAALPSSLSTPGRGTPRS
eukprot:15130738-Alexandrium_andersonii.AAC.1